VNKNETATQGSEEDFALGKECFAATTRKQARDAGGLEGWPVWENLTLETKRTYQKAALVEGSPLLAERAARN
jgi:hypothetical protein